MRDLDGETLDAIVWLGAYNSDQAAHACRLVQFRHGTQLHQYLTNVLDPTQLTLQEIAQLYARSFDIELAIKLLKWTLGIRLWWSAHPTLVLQQLWIVLTLAQVLHAIQLEVAAQAHVDVWDVRLSILAKLLAHPCAHPTPLIPLLVEQGRVLGLIRPSQSLADRHASPLCRQVLPSVCRRAPASSRPFCPT